MPSPRILLLSGVRGDTRRYRTVHPYEQLRLTGVDCTLSHISDPHLRAHARQADVVMMHRAPWDAQVKWLIDTLRSRGGLVIQDTDDLVFDPAAFEFIDSPDFVDPVRAALYQEDMRRNRLTLEACDAVTASTDYLAERACALGKPAWVHRNAFSLEMLARSEQAYRQRPGQRSQVVIGYASGTPTHNHDFALVKPALQEILRRYPQTELHLIGHLDPGRDWGMLADRIRHSPLVPWRDLPALLGTFDINLAPLRSDNPFGQSKSEIKYMEAALLRVPTIASPTAAFQHAIQPGENGLLAGEWLNCLEELIAQPGRCREMGEKAFTDVVARYHPANRAAELVHTLNQIAQGSRGAPIWDEAYLPQADRSTASAQPWVASNLERSPSLAQLAVHNLRYRGVHTLLLQARVFLRRLVAPIFPYRRKS
jgi:glycosyltransferase involved in cell wall biosynthesis